MKILITLFDIQDYGGIINHTEYLVKGLKQLGIQVDIVKLSPSSNIVRPSPIPKDIDQYSVLEGGTGYQHHQFKGWYGLPKVNYLNDYQRQKFIDKSSTYDAVIWQIPIPTLNKQNTNVSEWVELYDNNTKNIAIIHDGNLPDLYPHLAYLQDKIHALACVHEAAFHSAKNIPIPRTMIFNPFDLSTIGEPNTENRSGFMAVQVFKGWKRVDELIKAIPRMQNTEPKVVGGAGIEYRYMTSKDKCKPKYFENGTRIWDNALNAGMNYIGVVPHDKVIERLQRTKLQIDPSWSVKYAKHGAHFNRTTIEAMIMGAVPMATELGMSNSVYFKPNINYIPILPKEDSSIYATRIDHALNSPVTLSKIQSNNWDLLVQKFDMKIIADQYINLITGSNVLQSCPKGELNDDIISKCNKNLGFFGIKSHINATRGTQSAIGGQTTLF